MNSQKIPFDQMIFVCTNRRDKGARISCAGEGRCGEEVLNQLKEFVKSHHIESKVRIAKSGCQEQCEKGPTLSIFPQNIMLNNVRIEDVEQIIKQYLLPLLPI